MNHWDYLNIEPLELHAQISEKAEKIDIVVSKLTTLADSEEAEIIELRDTVSCKILQSIHNDIETLSRLNEENVEFSACHHSFELSETLDKAQDLLRPITTTANHYESLVSLQPTDFELDSSLTNYLEILFFLKQDALEILGDEPKDMDDEELKKAIAKIKEKILAQREAVRKYKDELAEGTTGFTQSDPTLILRMLTGYLTFLLVELSNRKAKHAELIGRLYAKRYRNAIISGNNQAAAAILGAWTLFLIVPYLPILAAAVPLGVEACYVSLFRPVVLILLKRLNDVVRGAKAGNTIVRRLGPRAAKYLYEALVLFLMRNIHIVILLQNTGVKIADIVVGDPTVVDNLRDLQKAVKKLRKSKNIKKAKADVLLKLVELIIAAK